MHKLYGALESPDLNCFTYSSQNETLQQQFNNYVLQLEQQEYISEGISWSFIEYPNNQDCLDLIEDKSKGIFATLDDECLVPKGSGEKLANRMHRALGDSHPRYSATAAQRIRSEFTIHHYAGPVMYSALTFVEKNRDELPREAVELFSGSSNPLVKIIFASTGSAKKGAGSICTTFRGQLRKLMEKIQTTTPYYVRCLKPNDQNKPQLFDRMRVTEQLHYGGVLQAVKIARSGFPYKMFPVDFFSRYRCIANTFSPKYKKLPRSISNGKVSNPSQACRELLDLIIDKSSPPDSDTSRGTRHRKAEMIRWCANTSSTVLDMQQIQTGKSKVFMRKEPYDFLESRRLLRISIAAVHVQAWGRRLIKRAWYARALGSIRYLQTWFRKILFRRKERERRRIEREARIKARQSGAPLPPAPKTIETKATAKISVIPPAPAKPAPLIATKVMMKSFAVNAFICTEYSQLVQCFKRRCH